MNEEMLRRAQELRDQIAPLVAELNSLQDAERDAANRALVGKCFKYRNCYSLPESDTDYWWAYRLVTGVDSGSLVVFDFQEDKNGRIEIERRDFASLSGWREIPPDEYASAWTGLKSKIGRMDPFAELGDPK